MCFGPWLQEKMLGGKLTFTKNIFSVVDIRKCFDHQLPTSLGSTIWKQMKSISILIWKNFMGPRKWVNAEPMERYDIELSTTQG
jgi:hypothetical protein